MLDKAILKNNNVRLYKAIISKGRPQNVANMQSLVKNVTWYVPEAETQSYIDAGAENVVVANGLVQARNLAIVDAGVLNAYCLELSDDLKSLKRLRYDEDLQDTTVDEVALEMIEKLEDDNLTLAGVSPTANRFFSNMKVSKNNFIVGDFIVISPKTPLMFDERFKLKEDYDYTMQHLVNSGGVIRLNYILAEFLHRTNSGGAVDDRTKQMEQQAIFLLKSKWGNAIQDNPKRPDEVLLKWSKKDNVKNLEKLKN